MGRGPARPGDPRLPHQGHLRRRDHHRRRPLPLHAHSGRDGHLPHLRGPPRGAVGGSGRPYQALRRPHGRGRGNRFRGMGPQRPRRARRRRLQLLGRHRHRHALPGLVRRVGALRPRRRRRRPLQVRDLLRRRILAPEGRPDGPGHRGAPGHRLGGHRPVPRVGGPGLDGQARHHRPPQRPDEHLRGPHRLVAPGPGLPRPGRGAGPLRQGGRLHPCRVPAGGRAPLRRVLGLPGHQLLRAHLALRHPGRLPLPGGPAPPGRHRRHPGLGARPLPQGRVGPGPLRRHCALRRPRPAAR